MIERAGPNDLMQLAFDVGPVPMHIAAVVLMEPAVAFDPDVAVAEVGRRLARVPRSRQRLVRPPIGCGRAYWVDDAGFDPVRHVRVTACAAPGDEAALLDAALVVTARPLSRSRPMWSATFLTGLADGRVALVIVLHHVVADGLGSLTILGELVDLGVTPREATGTSRFPRPAPSRRALAADAWTTRLQAVAGVPELLRRLRAGVTELGAARVGWAPRTSLNRPTRSRRDVRVVRADLAAVVAVAHAHGGTVNGVVLAAVTGALGGLLAARGEVVPRLVVSVPVSGRSAANRVEPGNQVGVIPMALPTTGDRVGRLESIAAITRTRKRSARGASAAWIQPASRALAALGLLGWSINHQRLVNTFVTNVRGPAAPVTFMDATVSEVIPLSGAYGNATVAFAALSYAGALAVTVVADPDAVPELPQLSAALQTELDSLTAAARGKH